MAIKESELQTIESLSDGDKLRVVTSEGSSRNIDASKVGDILFMPSITITPHWGMTNTYTCDKEFSELAVYVSSETLEVPIYIVFNASGSGNFAYGIGRLKWRNASQFDIVQTEIVESHITVRFFRFDSSDGFSLASTKNASLSS